MIDRNDRQAIEAGLRSADPADPYARAVASELERFGKLLQEQVAFAGRWPKTITMPPLKDELSRIALALFLDAVGQETGRRPKVIHK